MKKGIELEQAEGLQKATDSTTLIEETITPIDQALFLDEHNETHKMSLAKGNVDAVNLTSSENEAGHFIVIKVLIVCMQ